MKLKASRLILEKHFKINFYLTENIMNKRLLLSTFAVLLITGFTQAADLQIGVVNVRAVASQAPQRETISAALQNEFKERGESLKNLEKEIKDMQTKGQADELTMSEQQKTDLIRSIQGKASDFQLKQKAFQEDFKLRSDEEQRKLLILIKKAIDQVALQDKFDIVLQSESVAYISDRVDITNKVITLMSDPKFN